MSKTTHIICILDRSTSMGRLQDEVITNFNKFLEEQQGLEGKAKMTLVLFDSGYEMVYDKVKLANIKPLNRDTFKIQGCTAMNDALGKTLTKMKKKKKAIVLIHTDGEENSSTQYNGSHIKEMVDSLKKKWEFIFVAGDLNAKEISASLGIMRSANVSNTVYGTQNTYANFSNTTSAYRSGGLVASSAVNMVEDGNFAKDTTANAVKDDIFGVTADSLLDSVNNLPND